MTSIEFKAFKIKILFLLFFFNKNSFILASLDFCSLSDQHHRFSINNFHQQFVLKLSFSLIMAWKILLFLCQSMFLKHLKATSQVCLKFKIAKNVFIGLDLHDFLLMELVSLMYGIKYQKPSMLVDYKKVHLNLYLVIQPHFQHTCFVECIVLQFNTNWFVMKTPIFGIHIYFYQIHHQLQKINRYKLLKFMHLDL